MGREVEGGKLDYVSQCFDTPRPANSARPGPRTVPLTNQMRSPGRFQLDKRSFSRVRDVLACQTVGRALNSKGLLFSVTCVHIAKF